MKETFISQDYATTASWIRLQENRQRKWGLYGVDSGIHDINMAIGGFIPRKVTTIAALPSHGKTALVTPMIEAASRYVDIKPEYCIFSWEMEASELVDRSTSFRTGLTSRDLMMGAKMLKDSDINKVKDSLERSKETPVVYHQESLSIDDLLIIHDEFVENCRAKTEEDGIERQPIFVLDYIGLASFEGSGIRTYGINEFYAKLKQSANRSGSHWVILAQLDKSARNKEIPDLNDLSDSQSIERNSDNVILLHRPEQLGRSTVQDPSSSYEDTSSANKMLVVVAKCRLFGIKSFLIACDMSKYRFWSINHPDVHYKYWEELYKKEEFWKSYFGYSGDDNFEIF